MAKAPKTSQQVPMRAPGAPRVSWIRDFGDSLLPFLQSNSINKLYSPKEANFKGPLRAHRRVCPAGNGSPDEQEALRDPHCPCQAGTAVC